MITDVEVLELFTEKQQTRLKQQPDNTRTKSKEKSHLSSVCACVCAAGMRTHETQKVNVRDNSECTMQTVPVFMNHVYFYEKRIATFDILAITKLNSVRNANS